MFKRLIVLTSFVLVLGLIGSGAAFGDVIEIRIADGGDDAEQHLDDGDMDIGSSDLEIANEDGGDPATDEQVVGLRFVGIPLDKDALVAAVYVEVEVDKVDKEGSGAPVNLIIEGELVPNAAAFEDVANNITDRAVTTAQVKWSVPAWTEQNAKFQTPDISSIILELIGQEDWAPGNAIVLILRDDKDDPSTGVREAESYEGEESAAPLLHIGLASEIDIPVANGGDDAEQHLDDGDMDIGSGDLELVHEDEGDPATDEQVIGLRFVNIPLDNGAPVVSAYVEVEVDKVDKQGSDAPVNLIIEGELVPDAAAFEDVANNITDRAVTTAQVKWSIPAWTEQNAKFQTPDISSILQEIVNQEGWVSGNAIVLTLRDDKDDPSTGLREAESYSGEADAAPTLHITGLLSLVKIATEPSPADGASELSPTPPLSTYISDDVPMNIPDRWETTITVTSSLSVADPITITDLNVELDISHSRNNADLDVYLIGPDGTQIALFTDVGLWDKNFKNTILDDEAGKSIKDGSGSYTGIFRPESDKLSKFDGKNAKGTWKLKISDDWNSGTGTLNSWRLVIESPIIINWVPAERIASQELYISDNFDDVSDSTDAAYQGNLAADAVAAEVALDLGQTYYWRIDALDADGALVEAGDIWSFSTAPGNVAIDQIILAGNDDGEDHIAYGDEADDGAESRGSSDLEMPWESGTGSSSLQVIGLRFADITVPPGMVGAYVQFTADNEKISGGPVNLIINGLLQPDPEGLGSGENFSEREPKTVAEVSWTDIPDWTSGQATPASRTPDISDIVNEITGQADWADGNALMLFLRDDETNPSADNRSALDAGEGVNVAPVLHIDAISEAAVNPVPADGAIDIAQDTILKWSHGMSAVSSDVYFGTDSSPSKLNTTTGTSYDVGMLTPSTTYYWKIDETDADGNKHTGAVWSFMTVIGEATEPSPADLAADVPVDVILSWTAGATAASYDVYFGTTDSPEFMGNQVETSFDPGGLAYGSVMYYWQVDAIEADGTTYVGTLQSFMTPSGQATDPDPADGALLEATSAVLGWTAGDGAALHDVYLGTDPNALEYQDSQFETMVSIDGFVPGTTYYWQIVEVEADGITVHEGPVWSFAIAPESAYDPSPADGTELASDAVVVLSWTAGMGAKLHLTYFGDDPNAVADAVGAPPMPSTTFDPGPLEAGKTYYWRVDEFNPPTTVTGQVWSFSRARAGTGSEPAGFGRAA